MRDVSFKFLYNSMFRNERSESATHFEGYERNRKTNYYAQLTKLFIFLFLEC